MLEVEDSWNHTYGDVSGYSREHPSHSVLGTARAVPSLSFPAGRFRTWGTNNPHELSPCPNAPLGTVQGHRPATRSSGRRTPR